MSENKKFSSMELAAVVHDVRQMLAVITGRSGLLRHGFDDPLILENLKAIETAATQANAVLSRLSSQPVAASSVTSDILQTFLQSTTLMTPKPGTSWRHGPGQDENEVWSWHGNIAEDSYTSVPVAVLMEVLNNLLLNSLAVMPQGGAVLVNLDRREDFWCLSLRDSGPGIPPEERHKIFELGFSSSGDSGRGIGLPASRDLLTKYGASLNLGPDDQPGACFELLLPFASALVEAPSFADQESGKGFRPNILIVDDDQAVREMLQDVFKELGCRVKVARDAPAATEIFPTDSFEMVVIDQKLPGMSGLEFAESLRRQDSNVILVLISGWGQEDILNQALGSVVDLVGEKPVTVEKIMEMLNEAGALHRLRLEGS